MKTVIFFFLLIGTMSAETFILTPETNDLLPKFCRRAQGGDTIYLRGGTYTRPFTRLKCRGCPQHPIHISAWPGETVTIRGSWRVIGDYLRISGLHFRGDADTFHYPEVIAQWWRPTRAIRRIGLFIQGHHIRLDHNAIGFYPASGVKFTGRSDYLTIDHNIIYNNAWWTTGGTGGLIIKNIRQIDANTSAKVCITDNLLFGNESRIISHVFKKGFARLVIDEGESFLIQQKDDAIKKDARQGHYLGRYLVKGNLILYNGKGTSLNKADHIDLIGNTLYGNGTTATSPNAAGIRGNHTRYNRIINNAIGTTKEGKAISIRGVNNFFKGNVAESRIQKPMPGLTLVSHLFRDPKHLDYATEAFGDRANKLLASFQPMLSQYHITVKPTGYQVDLNKQIATIISTIPRTSATRIEHTPKAIVIHHIDRRGIKGMGEDFVLRLR